MEKKTNKEENVLVFHQDGKERGGAGKLKKKS